MMILAAFFFTNAVGDILPFRNFQCASAEEDKEEGLLGAALSLFDPNEKTKSGKILPKSYLKSAREVVKNLRESLKEDVTDIAKFRRSADSAKESIKEFMQNWTDQKTVSSEEQAGHCLKFFYHQDNLSTLSSACVLTDSYMALISAIRVLAGFYSKKGPTAALPEDIKSKIIDDLNIAEAAL